MLELEDYIHMLHCIIYDSANRAELLTHKAIKKGLSFLQCVYFLIEQIDRMYRAY